jgi:hypothetical protein
MIKMMKRRLFVFVLLVLLCFTGCSSGTPETEEPAAVVEEAVAAEPEAEPEPEEAAEEMEKAEVEEPFDLLNFLQPRQFDTLVVETEISGIEGLMTKSIVYQKGENTRTEMEMPGGQKQIMILQAEEGVTYQYAEGSMQGMKIVHGNLDAVMDRDRVMGGKMEKPDFMDVRNRMDEHMVVRKEELNGEKAIYIEFNEINEDVENAVVKMWYSEEYAYPIRYELFVNDELMMRSDVTKLEVDIDLEDSLFMPPEGVEFMEVNMEGGFEMPDMPDSNE